VALPAKSLGSSAKKKSGSKNFELRKLKKSSRPGKSDGKSAPKKSNSTTTEMENKEGGEKQKASKRSQVNVQRWGCKRKKILPARGETIKFRTSNWKESFKW